MFCFGLSKSFTGEYPESRTFMFEGRGTGIVLSRALAGGLSGNVSIVKAMVGEISDTSNQARAYSLLPLMAGLGASLGPLIGSIFAHPAERFPKVFGDFELLKTYPYLLACLVAALNSLASATFGFFYLNEVCSSPDCRLIFHQDAH